MKVSYINQISEEELRKLVASSIGYSEILRSLGYRESGGGPWRNLKKRIQKLNIDVSHFKGKAHGKSKTQKYELDEILIKDSTYTNISTLKKRLIKEGLKENRCEKCGITEWMREPLIMQLHHINGINNDHRLSNLQMLCPNCHSQTENYAGRNI